MALVLYVRIQADGCKYAKYVVTSDLIREYGHLSEVQVVNPEDREQMKLSRVRIIFRVNGVFLHYFVRELMYCRNYRENFVKFYVPNASETNRMAFKLENTTSQIIDYKWNERLSYLVRERCELENALSWLSTLGGAFSALGDYFDNFALVAGKISYHQLELAVRMGDPTIASRCRLYFSLSLIQRQKFKLAKKIIRNEYEGNTNAVIVDTRLVKMCLGIWSKLRYEHQKFVDRKKSKRSPNR